MKTVIGLFRAALNIIYSALKLFKTENKIVFLSRQSDNISVDFRLLGEEIKNQHPEYKTVFLCRRIPSGIMGKFRYAFHMLRQMYHLATARAAVTDSYCIALSLLKHKKSLEIIQIWHALGNMKKFGYAMLGKPEGSDRRLAKAMRMHKNYDHLFISSMSFAKDFTEGFNMPEDKLVELPLPRVDLLTDKAYAKRRRKELSDKYPALRGKKNILYCPTFRKSDSHTQNAAKELLKYIDKNRYNLILSAHPVSAEKAENPSGILRFSEPTFELLFAADFVISDYSTVFYEAGLLGLPIFSYAFDWEEYRSRREINFDIEKDFPSLFTEDPKKIIKAIENEAFDREKIKAFIDRNVSCKKEKSAKLITDFIFKEIENKNK